MPSPKLPSIYDRVRQILESARVRAARSVNTAQVVAHWLVGREIVEEEQKGKGRAGYGKKLVESLSARITRDFGPGYSAQNLFYFKQFYLIYAELLASDQILHAVRGESSEGGAAGKAPILHALRGESRVSIRPSAETWKPGRLHSNLSWTHYRTLLRVERPEVRGFYELESLKNHWGARELERQINSF